MALAAISFAGAAGNSSPAPRLVWSGPEVTLLGGPSRDGRYLSYVEPGTGNLAIRELAAGRSRVLTHNPPGSPQFAYFSAISPDSRRVAYAWFNDRGFYELRVIDLDGSNMRVLYRNEEAGFVQPCAWTPDASAILTLLFRSDNISQIALVPAAGGPPRVLRSLNWVYPKRMDLSPDGKSIVYDSFAGEAAGDRTVWLLSADGSGERKLIGRPGNHLFPLWTPDGRKIVYASDASGTMDLWELPFESGASPRLLRRDLGRFLPMGISSEGDLYYGLRTGNTEVFVTTLSDPVRDARRATLRFPGRNTSPAWSADGKRLAYLSRRGTENFGQESRAVVIRRMDSDEERELLPKLAHIERVRWAADGTTLLAGGSDGKGRGGLFSIDAQSGAATPLIAEAGAPYRGFEGAWARDRKTLFYLRDNELRQRDLNGGRESTLYSGKGLFRLAMAGDGKTLAIGAANEIVLLSLEQPGSQARSIRFDGLTDLDVAADLVAARGAELWRVPLDGGAPVKLAGPGNREGGFSLHPDGKRIALAAGNLKSEIWALRLP